MNNWSFTGNLGKDAEQRFTPGGDSIVSFSVAVKAGYGDKATTTWARCSMFGKRGDSVLQYLNKGQLVGVCGELSSREYQKDGQPRTSIEVRVNDLTLLGKSDGSRQERDKPADSSKQAPPSSAGNFNDFDDDIPF
jgi:single-strand DNA-binding protein